MLLVAMGNPKQDLWIANNLHRLNVPVCIGVGALFDYLSEKVARAPQWMLEAGVEWVFRLWKEPRRLWKRYLLGNPKFIIRVWRENTGHEKRSRA
jgi:exopolysaccharide biosynthesis WecB/TagA/CpsF family protein